MNRSDKSETPTLSPIKWLLVVAGVLFTGLGFIGIFIPLLPTTPFLLLAAACFMRSSRRLYVWLITHKIFGYFIYNYRHYHAITLKTKAGILVMLWLTLGYSFLFVVTHLFLRALLLIIGMGVTIHILSLKTLTSEMMERDKQIFEKKYTEQP
ncbi:YbaN family protein [candidate division KSB1 bacterium]|nr:YbaN family protein [candidate division KSB1 bacterium]